MKELMIMYHPVKKEIRFFGRFKGDFVEIPYEDCPHLVKYSPGSGEFLLQNQGSNFFDDIWEQFSKDNVNLTFKGTKIDYEDFRKKVADYNEEKEKEIFKIADYIELPNVSEIYEAISDFCGEALESFDSQLKNQETKQMFRLRKKLFDERKAVLDQDEVNLCLVGTYSAGKSTFINAIIGKRILPESINSETAKMFKIRNEYNPRVSFVLNTTREEKPDNIQIIWNAAINQFEVTKSQNSPIRQSICSSSKRLCSIRRIRSLSLCMSLPRWKVPVTRFFTS